VFLDIFMDRVFDKIWGAVKGLKKGFGEVFVCLVLDEADSIFSDKHYDPSEFFYRFLRHQSYLEDSDIKVCIVVIANNPGVLEERLDSRVKSSMGSEMIHFGGYSGIELEQILRSRVGVAFKRGFVDEGVVELCASLVSEHSGDARKAIDLLRVSGELANKRKSKVNPKCVHGALELVEKDYLWEMLKGLASYMKSVVMTIAFLTVKGGEFSTQDLYKQYNKPVSAKSDEENHLSERRILDLVTELETIGVVSTWNVSKGRGGYGKQIRLNVDATSVLAFYLRDT